MKNETRRVVYIHPKGYYAIVERRGKGKLGGEYKFKETIYPPFPWQKNEPAPKPQPIRTTKASRITEQDKAGFITLCRQGYTADEIAAISGWSKTTVFRYLSLAGLIRRQKKLTDGERTQIINMARDGATYADIAGKLGVSKQTVSANLRAMGRRRYRSSQKTKYV